MAGNIKDRGKVITYDDKSRETRNAGRHLLSRSNEYFEHFNKITTIPPGLVLVNVNAVTAATYGTGLSGRAVLTSDDVAAVGAWLTHTGLLWQANSQTATQPMVFETRLAAGSTVTSVEYFHGFLDTLTAVDTYALSSTSTFTTSASNNAAMIGWSTTPTSGAAFQAGGNPFVGVASNATVDQVVADGALVTAGVPSGRTLAASTFYTWRVEVDSAGNAAYFIDETFLGAIGAAVAITVPLAPQVGVIPRTTSERIATVDYFYCGGM